MYELAVSGNYHNVTGKYFDNDQGTFAKAHPDAYDEEKTNKLIATTVNLLAN